MATAKNPKISVPTVSTSALMKEVSGKFREVPKKITKELLQSFLEIIEGYVTSGNKVRIDKLGILQVKDRAARSGRNPQTGESIAIPASKKVAFRVALTLKEAVGAKKKKIDKPAANKKAQAKKTIPKKKKVA